MGLDIWFRDDLKNIITGQARAVGQTPVSAEYWQGYQDALINLALALGIDLELPGKNGAAWEIERPPELTDGRIRG